MLWQNEPSVIVGRFQDVYSEVNLEFINNNNIKLARRNSGGGAVYHDLGNLNYSFIIHDAKFLSSPERQDLRDKILSRADGSQAEALSPEPLSSAELAKPHENFSSRADCSQAKALSPEPLSSAELAKSHENFLSHDDDLNNNNNKIFKYFAKFIINALGKLGVTCELSGRNDILFNNQKISGMAIYKHNNIILCHGTLLYDCDLNIMNKALSVDNKILRDKLARHGVKSIKSRVINLKNYLVNIKDINELKLKLQNNFELKPFNLQPESLSEIDLIMQNKYLNFAFTAQPVSMLE
ncbi:MAG: lipoate--protein ligase family protein [Synergistaceae bacterium]|nr:lipoate--protein ligase family protein [Synergistaceae bacterium]